MVRVERANDIITLEELEQMQEIAADMEKENCLKMTILYYFGQLYSVSGTYKADDFIITLS